MRHRGLSAGLFPVGAWSKPFRVGHADGGRAIYQRGRSASRLSACGDVPRK